MSCLSIIVMIDTCFVSITIMYKREGRYHSLRCILQLSKMYLFIYIFLLYTYYIGKYLD